MVEDEVARWLHAVELTPGSDRQQAIIAAARSYALSPAASDPRDMVLLSHSVPGADAAYEALCAAVTAADATFGCAIDELETRLIAGVLVAALIEGSAAAASTAAYFVLNAKSIGLTAEIADLPALATESLARSAEAVRSRRPIQSAAPSASDLPDFDSEETPATQEDVRRLRDGMAAALDATATRLESLTSQMSTRLRASDEELDLLWWCVSGRSERLRVDWSAIDDPGLVAIAASFEMVDLLAFAPHPSSAVPLLARILGAHKDKQVTLKAAVDASGEQGFAIELAGHQLLPVLSSLREHAELGGDGAWTTSVKRWSIDPNRKWTGLDLATECLRELMIVNYLS